MTGVICSNILLARSVVPFGVRTYVHSANEPERSYMTPTSLLSKIEAMSIPVPMSGCWVWLANTTQDGYASMWWQGITRRAHRAIYEEVKGPIPAGLHIDHICRVRCCVNPDHLRAVSPQFNVLVGETVTAKNAARRACVAGHKLAGDNLLLVAGGRRQCRECGRRRAREYQRAKHGWVAR